MITIRHLMNHTSGVFDFYSDQNFFKQFVRNRTRTWTPQERVAVATGHKPLFAPGAGWSYSNTGYVLLGLIVEKVTGHSLVQELRGRIFSPLGLRATSAPTTPQIEGRHARVTVATPYGKDQKYGLGLMTGRLSCGTVWGHDGDFAGYQTTTWNSRDGRRQVVIMVNSSSLSQTAKKQVNRLIESAYCR